MNSFIFQANATERVGIFVRREKCAAISVV